MQSETIESARRFGFLESLNSAESLSGDFAFFHALASNVSDYLSRQALGKLVDELPVVTSLPSSEELHLAKMALSLLAQAYVWESASDGVNGPRRILPKALAIPLVNVSRALQEKLIYLYADHTLRNSRLINRDGPLELSNMRSDYTFSGTPDEDQFVVVHTAYDAIGVAAVEAAIEIMENQLEGAEANMRLGLISDVLDQMRKEFLKVRSIVSPDVFRDKIRLYLMGWHGNVPDMQYEGCDLRPSELRGETGAGSALLPFFDRFASVFVREQIGHHLTHHPASSHIDTYFDFDRFRPIEHRNILKWTESRTNMRDLAKEGGINVACYNNVVQSILEMRKAHMVSVGVYMKGSSHPNMQGGYGTGGSLYSDYLHSLVEETRNRLL
ncbi:MAG: hypothetical protein ACR2O8_02805 [Rhizobiaceae bacterium]